MSLHFLVSKYSRPNHAHGYPFTEHPAAGLCKTVPNWSRLSITSPVRHRHFNPPSHSHPNIFKEWTLKKQTTNRFLYTPSNTKTIILTEDASFEQIILCRKLITHKLHANIVLMKLVFSRWEELYWKSATSLYR